MSGETDEPHMMSPFPDLPTWPPPLLSNFQSPNTTQMQLSSSPPSRPVPSTLLKMTPYEAASEQRPSGFERTPTSRGSAIPRPKSGTSRWATPTGMLTFAESISANASSVAPARLQQRTLPHEDGFLPTSWSTTRSRLPRSESLLPYSEREFKDLSGVKQQLQMRQYSTQSLPEPDAVGSKKQDLHPSIRALPKSNTSGSLPCPRGEPTPRRRLMRLLEPPLPRSHTFGNISNPTQPKSTSTRTNLTPLPPSRTQVDVIDALLESRMTDWEIQVMNQVQREASINQQRLQDHHFEKQHRRMRITDHDTTRSSFLAQQADCAAVVNLSVNDVVNIRRLEDQRHKAASGRPLFINSILANTNFRRSESYLPSPKTVDSTGSSGPEDEWEVNLKLVHFAEDKSYWIGRYMTLCDRLRTEELGKVEKLPMQKSPVDDTFEASEDRRLLTALDQLRQCCRTTQALTSFEKFEAELKKTCLQHSAISQHANSYSISRNGEARGAKQRVASSGPRNGLSPPQSSAPVGSLNTATTSHDSGDSRPQSRVWSRITLTKSKTTGNLAALVPKAQPKFLSPASVHPKNPVRALSPKHDGRTPYMDCSPERRAKALQEREERATKRAAEARRLSGNRKSSGHTGRKDNTSENMVRQTLNQKSNPRNDTTQIVKMEAFDGVGSGMTCAMLESGHAAPPTKTLAKAESQSTLQPVVDVVDGEKVVRSQRRSERQSSGEMVRGLFGAGIREVRRMGRRVGGRMSWAASSEDLSS